MRLPELSVGGSGDWVSDTWEVDSGVSVRRMLAMSGNGVGYWQICSGDRRGLCGSAVGVASMGETCYAHVLLYATLNFAAEVTAHAVTTVGGWPAGHMGPGAIRLTTARGHMYSQTKFHYRDNGVYIISAEELACSAEVASGEQFTLEAYLTANYAGNYRSPLDFRIEWRAL